MAIREADVGANDLGQLAVLHALLEDLDDGELQTLGVDVAGWAAEHVAHVLPVGHGRGEGDDLSLQKMGRVKIMWFRWLPMM